MEQDKMVVKEAVVEEVVVDRMRMEYSLDAEGEEVEVVMEETEVEVVMEETEATEVMLEYMVNFLLNPKLVFFLIFKMALQEKVVKVEHMVVEVTPAKGDRADMQGKLVCLDQIKVVGVMEIQGAEDRVAHMAAMVN